MLREIITGPALRRRRNNAIAEQQSSGLQVPAYEHFTFAFAQQAHIPHHAREVGALYFKVPRRIQIFGVAAEAVPAQHNYLFEENETIGVDGSKCRGPNSVVSLLHFHLQHHAKGAHEIGLHADNCCGQNKNKTVVGYLCWRVIVGINASIDLCFMRIGHTRCFVDGGFGLLKQTCRKSDVDTLQQLANATDKSAAFNKAVLFSWDWRQWDAYLPTVFKPLKNTRNTRISTSRLTSLGWWRCLDHRRRLTRPCRLSSRKLTSAH